MGFLKSLLPDDLPDRGNVVMPFYPLMSDPYHQHYIQKFRDGNTRVLVGTDTLTCGMDVADIHQVVILGVPPCPERMTQQIGRAGRDGEPARAVICVPAWM